MIRKHVLRFAVEARSWETAERLAASRIRTYTVEHKRGPDARSDDQVLRDAVFTVTPVEGKTALWHAEVEVVV